MRTPLITAALFLFALGAVASQLERPLSEDAGIVPTHRLPLFDENALPVVPTLPQASPMSVRNTCGGCHDYDAVTGGLHFNASRADAGRPGEPWVWVDEATGTALPISARGWPGVFTPEEIGLTPWRFTQIFGPHLPGAGLSEPPPGERLDAGRWDVSGVAEANCLGCHNHSPMQDLSEWARQMKRENFRWAATAAGGLGEVPGMASRLPGSWAPFDGTAPDDLAYRVAPSVDYREQDFENGGVWRFDLGRPEDRNCLQCHSLSHPGEERRPDVHGGAGMSCVDCHRNGLDHDMIRGYEGEAAERGDPEIALYTCRGCHLGDSESDALADRGGLYGAPRPEHRGLPPIHFDTMTCTACHSGALNAGGPGAVRTARANRLNVHGRARWDTDLPRLAETVFVRNANDKIEPRRILWPSFWARLTSGGTQVLPLTPDVVAPRSEGILDVQSQVRPFLDAFAQLPDVFGEPVFGVDGDWFAAGPNGLRRADGVTSSAAGPSGFGMLEDGVVEPIVPPFDVQPELVDYQAQLVLRNVFKALAMLDLEGEPAYAAGGALFRRTVDDAIVKEIPQTPPPLEASWLVLGEDGVARPFVSDSTADAVRETVGAGVRFTEEQIARTLGALAEAHPGETFGFVSGGMLFTRDDAGALDAREHSAAAPVTWAAAHAVRPAAQSLGAGGCTDCHTADSNFFFATVRADGPLVTERLAALPMHALEAVDPSYEKLFGLSFRLRGAFKVFGWIAAGALALLLLAYAPGAARRLTRRIGGAR